MGKGASRGIVGRAKEVKCPNAADRRPHKGWPMLPNDHWRQADRRMQIYPLDIGVRKNPVKENVVRWAWRDAGGSGKWTESPGWLLPAFAFAADNEMACDGLNFK